VPTLKQVLERIDGTGAPHGLKADKILVTARIVTVANTYVALVSPRAHRPSLGFKDAVENMMRDVDKVFDRRVVLALANYIENRPNKLDWLTTAKQ
ncbi:MAG TPA: HD domain-containing phosphohydrolase, partial [Alphaproteobacteria bacterium]|nr:HD domain-containing phosphohydrolase [Alphaproteobacteria bacterium]